MNRTNHPIARMQLPAVRNGSGLSLDDEECQLLVEFLERGELRSGQESLVDRFENRFAQRLESAFGIACSSGTAAMHAAIAAIDPEPGDEIVTSGMGEMGTVAPMLYQGAIPVFADLDPATGNMTAELIQACLSHRTRAIVVPHLFGNPCQIDKIVGLAQRYEIPLIEDGSHAILASYGGRSIGTFGDIGCFSLRQGNHLSAGEGGVIVTNSPRLAKRMRRFINKSADPCSSTEEYSFLALNYRMPELSAALASVRVERLENSVARRIAMAELLNELLADTDGISRPPVDAQAVSTYGSYALFVDSDRVLGGANGLGEALQQDGLDCAPGYIRRPLFQCPAIRDQRTFGNSRFPFMFARREALDYAPERFPGTLAVLSRLLVLPWHDRYSEEQVHWIADRVLAAVAQSVPKS